MFLRLFLSALGLENKLVQHQLAYVGPLNCSFGQTHTDELLHSWTDRDIFFEIDGIVENIDEILSAGDSKRVGFVYHLIKDYTDGPYIHALVVLIAN